MLNSKNTDKVQEQRLFSSHGQGDSLYNHATRQVKTSVLGVAVLLTLGFSAVELIGGLLSNSLALIGDAGHMATDAASLLFALVANWLAREGADSHHSFGHARIEVLAAFINALIMFVVLGWICYEAIDRLTNPHDVSGGSVMLIATIGLFVNIAVALSLSRDKKNVNTRAALVHVLGDLLGSVAAIISGAVIYFGGPVEVDPILSLLICALVAHAAWGVLKETVPVMLDAVPEGVNFDDVGEAIASIPGVVSVHDLHVWVMSPGYSAITAHLHIDSHQSWPVILEEVRKNVKERFNIDHVALQPEWESTCPLSEKH
ncbi:cation diffusion facilitator family transporter [Parasutterella secunda]|uniref:Cation transporter n=1 Tax=Parasutterella secunda TaxID=626947 RepID=A0ABS2GWQ0_9BURK|nr:cation diffusion facilitator family transporter [Parasutterella secunda]MBM6929156.1 cation transporter [Parasutterella secunda]